MVFLPLQTQTNESFFPSFLLFIIKNLNSIKRVDDLVGQFRSKSITRLEMMALPWDPMKTKSEKKGREESSCFRGD